MKKLLCFLTFFAQFSPLGALAQSPAQDYQNHYQRQSTHFPSVHNIRVKQESPFGDFFFKPSLSIEYNAPRISGSGVNSNFKVSGALFHQVSDLQNVSIGGNFRIHKYLGFNANWVQSDLVNSELQGVTGDLSERAQFRFDQYNLSALFYVPAVANLFEVFAEGGVADIRSRLTYSTTPNNPVNETSHEIVGFYGAGFQILLNEENAFRLSWQRYMGRIGLINSNYSTMRVGYLMAF